MKRNLSLLLATAMLALPFAPSIAQENPGQRVVHFVKAGETVEQIAQQYLNDGSAAEELRAYNQIAPEGKVEAGFPMVIPGGDRAEAVDVLVRADAAMRAAVEAMSSEFALDEFKQAVDVMNAAVKSRKAASYVRAKVLGEVAIEQFAATIQAANRNARESQPAKVLAVLGTVELLAKDGSEWAALTDKSKPGAASVVRVADGARVSLALPGGDEVTAVGPAEFVLAELSQDRRNGVVESLLVATRGLLDVSVADGKASASTFRIQAGGSEAALKPGLFRVDSRSSKEATFAAVAGDAVVQAGGVTLALPKGQAASLREGQAASLNRVPGAPILTQPAGKNITTSKQVVDFTWQLLPGRVGYIVEIARDADFRNLLVRREVREAAYSTDVLNPGKYFVRVSAVVNGIQGEATDAVALSVERNLDVAFGPLTSVAGKDVLIVGPGVVVEAVPAKEDHSVARFEYSIDGRPWEASEAGVKLPASGQFEVKARGVGADGQTGKEIKSVFLVDGRIPELRIHIGEVVDFPGYGKIRSLAVLVDDNTKVGEVTYSINGGATQAYELPLKLSVKENHRLVIHAKDVFGNTAENILTLEALTAKTASPSKGVTAEAAETAPPADNRRKGFLGIF